MSCGCREMQPLPKPLPSRGWWGMGWQNKLPSPSVSHPETPSWCFPLATVHKGQSFENRVEKGEEKTQRDKGERPAPPTSQGGRIIGASAVKPLGQRCARCCSSCYYYHYYSFSHSLEPLCPGRSCFLVQTNSQGQDFSGIHGCRGAYDYPGLHI